MTSRPFIETRHCRSGLHCVTCRDLEGGRAFREDRRTRSAVPGDVADFECPRGRFWGWRARDRGLGDTVTRVIHAVTGGRVSPCSGCLKRRDLLNRLVPYGKAGKK